MQLTLPTKFWRWRTIMRQCHLSITRQCHLSESRLYLLKDHSLHDHHHCVQKFFKRWTLVQYTPALKKGITLVTITLAWILQPHMNLQVFAVAPCPALPPGSALPFRCPTTCRRFARYKMCMWLSAIVPFVAGFGNLPVQGRCCWNLDLALLCFIAGEAIATSSTRHFVG